MEYFPATSAEQVEFLHQIIEECDFYLLIVAGSYGSLHKSGLSFTEREFDYAVSRGKPVIAFLHKSPDSLPLDRQETDPGRQQLLKNFREKIGADRVVAFWTTEDELAAQVVLGLARERRMRPGGGWVHSSEAVSAKTVEQLAELTRERDQLRSRVEALETEASSAESAIFDSHFSCRANDGTAVIVPIGRLALAFAENMNSTLERKGVVSTITGAVGRLLDRNGDSSAIAELMSLGLLSKRSEYLFAVDRAVVARAQAWNRKRRSTASTKSSQSSPEQTTSKPSKGWW